MPLQGYFDWWFGYNVVTYTMYGSWMTGGNILGDKCPGMSIWEYNHSYKCHGDNVWG